MKLKLTLCTMFCVLLIFCSAFGLAASKTTAQKEAADVPKLKITGAKSFDLGGFETYTVNASAPGFASIYLQDISGNRLLTVLDNGEIHSKDNEFTITTYADDGSLIREGEYQLVATMTTQYGVSSDTATFAITIKPDADFLEQLVAFGAAQDAAVAAQIAAEDSGTAAVSTVASADSYDSTGYDDDVTDEGAYDVQTAPVAIAPVEAAPVAAAPVEAAPVAAAPVAATPVEAAPVVPAADPNAVTYRTNTALSIGDEGYQIGVGVSDVYPQTAPNYWALTANSSDAEIWTALITPITSVNVGEKETATIFDSTSSSKSKLGTVSGLSQGLNVLVSRSDGWSLVEAFRNEDGAFIRGYIKTNKLKINEVNQTYGIVIDKATQTLTAYMNGQRIGSCLVCTGKPTPEYLKRETPAGEFMLVTRRGTTEYITNRGYSKYTIRFNGNYAIQEIPTTKKNGSDYSLIESYLGTKTTRGAVCVQARASQDGGINAEWIWKLTENNKKVKVLIFDDKTRDMVPVGK